ncbi:DinB family protein [Mucilaginibacter segetis]|uniref:DinB family protein n=1 Tax=Mucilaginibacter segetis TaxID=2793071 RepID=A0A934PVZ9_9SPHI|nr:DinB family protein [Mucilaginibacter segetis]MBK0380552.1 DinB family protein [Mucilaginibacter segetis]
MNDEHKILINELVKLLEGGGAHASLDDALNGLPANLRGAKPNDLPYSIWQLAEHIRIAQWDMLEFCRDSGHVSPNWPDDYWPKHSDPDNEEVWNKTLEQIKRDRNEFIRLLKSGDIYKSINHGSGQNILREALQIADHTAYHTAEIIVIRRLLNAWH